MILWFYRLPLWFVIINTLFFIYLYANCLAKFNHNKLISKVFNIINFSFFIFSCYLILYATLYNRNNFDNIISIIPFISLKEAQIEPETYRTLLMNVILFVPFGISVSNVLNYKLNFKYSVIITILCGLVFSISIESIQLIFKCGNVQTDDVIANCFGAYLGTLNLYIKKIKIYKFLDNLYFN